MIFESGYCQFGEKQAGFDAMRELRVGNAGLANEHCCIPTLTGWANQEVSAAPINNNSPPDAFKYGSVWSMYKRYASSPDMAAPGINANSRE